MCNSDSYRKVIYYPQTNTPYADITAKAKELENLIKKIETKEERWFELSAKMEG